MRSVFKLAPCLAAAMLLAGYSDCDHNRYELELKPEGDTLQRKLTCRRLGYENDKEVAREFPADLLTRIAKGYPERLSPADALTHVFQGSFKGKLPADLGGTGQYVRLATRMGAAAAYTERYCGDDDQARQLDRSRIALDRLVDHAIGWFNKELSGQPGLTRLRVYIGRDLRGDLQNVLVHAALAVRVADYDERGAEEMGARIGQLLIERGYVPPEQAPEVISGIYRVELDDKAPELMAFVQRLAARKMGLPDDKPVPPALGFLTDAELATRSFGRYLETTDAYKLLLERWQGERIENPEASRPDPTDVVEPLFTDLLPFEIFGPDSRLEAGLALPVQPFATNGEWQADRGRLQWSKNGICKDLGLPTYLYAAWSEPDNEFQKRHFGKPVLAGQDLAEYVMWRRGLSEVESKRWAAFLDTLEPGPDLLAKLGAFRFAGEQPPGPPEAPTRSLADVAVGLIAPALAPSE